jgi:hypothetical protein
MKNKLDSEIKTELLIKLAFGISIEDLAKEYSLTRDKIVNLRKNNYLRYNEFFNHWKIDKEVAALGLSPKLERALSVIKKFYKDKIVINSPEEIYFKDKRCYYTDVMKLADDVLRKDNITCFLTMPAFIKNYYQ